MRLVVDVEGEITVVAVVIFEDCVHDQLYFVVVVFAASRSPGCSLDPFTGAVIGIVAHLLSVIALYLGVVATYVGE